MKKVSLLLIILLQTSQIFAQDSTDVSSPLLKKDLKFKYEALIIPATLVGFGVIGLESESIKNINNSTRDEIKEHIDEKLSIDDFSQYAPFASVYALNAFGIKGKNNFKDRTIILTTAYLIMGGTVGILKSTATVDRPDGSSSNSFPSGHTATAFMGAEFLYQEYKDVSIWYGISGYAIATGTGFFRMYNNRHWLTDVAAGAGIGILSTKIAYWVHPFIKETLFKDKKDTNGIIVPFYNGKEYGLGAVVKF